jgi:putative PIN family toxin of toxin-antitoxin system
MSVSERRDLRRVVLDTNVVVSGLLSGKSTPGKIIDLFLAGELKLFYNNEILEEYADVLYRPHLQIPVKEANDVMVVIHRHGEEVRHEPSDLEMKDEDDRVFYDVAVSAKAYLITGNIKHYPNEPFILKSATFLELKIENK